MRFLLLSLLLAWLSACTATAYSSYQLTADRDTYAQDSVRVWPRGPSLELDLGAVQGLGYEAILVAQEGRLVFEWYDEGMDATSPRLVYSITKSVLSALVGIAVEAGEFDLDAPLETLAGCAVPEHLQPLTPRHLLTMSAGFAEEEARSLRYLGRQRWSCLILGAPVNRPNGEAFEYGSIQSYLLGVALSQAVGEDLGSYAQSRLFERLDVDLNGWTLSPEGYHFGGGEMRLDARDLLAFGQLYVEGGVYAGQQIVPRAWVEQSLIPVWQGLARNGDVLDWSYSQHWWQVALPGEPQVLAAVGYGAYLILVDPSADLVMVAMPRVRPPVGAGFAARRYQAVLTLLSEARRTLARN